MIETTEPVQCNHQHRQLHLGGQIAHKIIGTNRHEPLARPNAVCAPFAFIVCIIERKIFAPSALPSFSSQARSGCGIKPKTFRSRFEIPAMFSIEPFGFASGTMPPFSSA